MKSDRRSSGVDQRSNVILRGLMGESPMLYTNPIPYPKRTPVFACVGVHVFACGGCTILHALGYTFLHTICIENGCTCTFLHALGLHVISFVGGTKGLQLPAGFARAETGDVQYKYYT